VGGGGGGGNGGGGGGSSWATPGATGISYQTGGNAGNGSLTLQASAQPAPAFDGGNIVNVGPWKEAGDNVYRAGGKVGIGTSAPTATLDVNGGIAAGASNLISTQGAHLQWNRTGGDGETWLLNQKGGGSANAGIRFGASDNVSSGANTISEWARFTDNGNFGIGTTSPSFPLDVQRTVTPANYYYAYLNGTANIGTATSTAPVSIRASGRILASEFNATSDRRLKTIVGRSSGPADLALLNQLRITDYTMKDRAAFGERAFKKVIAQEVEEVFPQAVSQHAGFLPDIYQPASAAPRATGDSLLQLTLPAALPVAATAGQRLKLIGPQGEVLARLVRPAAAGSRTLLVRPAGTLAGGQMFVFGLEHADVRAVDYEALGMLNVSATQELARKVAGLEARAATAEAVAATAAAKASAAETKAAQATAALETFEARLRRLEAVGEGRARR
jgi:hypothetical protein